MLTNEELEYVIVPAKFLPELKKLPDEVLDIKRSIDKVAMPLCWCPIRKLTVCRLLKQST